MERVREKILRETIAHYGRGPQQLKAIEELSELIQALAKADDPDNIAEEMADVRIMLDQLELIFNNHERVRQYEFRKLQRLNFRTKAATEVT